MTVSANDQLISGSGQFDPYAMSGIQTDLIVAGPVHLFSERRLDRLQPLRFDASNNNGYMAIELPMILLALIPATFGCLLMRHARKYNLTQTRDGG